MVRAFSLSALPVQRLFGADALSQPVVITVLALLTTNRLLSVLATGPENLERYLQIFVLPTLSGWVVFSVCALIVNRVAAETSLTRVVLVMVTYLATGLGREILLINAPGPPVFFTLDPGARLVTALMTSLVMFPVVAGFVADARRYSASVTQVSGVKARLSAAVRWSGKSLAESRLALIGSVRSQLETAFAPLINSNTSVSVRSALGHMSELSRITESVVQPLSSELAQAAPRYKAGESDVPPMRVTVSSVLDIATRTNPFMPGLYIWGSILLDAAMFVTAMNWTERFWALSVLAALGLVHLVARQTITPHLTKFRLRWRLVVVGIVYNISLLPISVFVFIFLGSGATAVWAAGFNFVLGWVFLGISAAKSGFGVARQNAIAEFDIAAKRLEWKVARINCQTWIEQRNLATFLHGEVQSLILVAQLRMQHAIDRKLDPETVISEVQELLTGIPAKIGKPEIGPNLQMFSDSLRDRWGTFLEFDFDYTNATRAAIDGDLVCVAVTREIVTEFVVNAVKHGSARRVGITLDANDDGVDVVLTSSNDAAGDSEPSDVSSRGGTATKNQPRGRVGLGSELLESVMVNRVVTVIEGEYRLTGTIPLERHQTSVNAKTS